MYYYTARILRYTTAFAYQKHFVNVYDTYRTAIKYETVKIQKNADKIKLSQNRHKLLTFLLIIHFFKSGLTNKIVSKCEISFLTINHKKVNRKCNCA